MLFCKEFQYLFRPLLQLTITTQLTRKEEEKKNINGNKQLNKSIIKNLYYYYYFDLYYFTILSLIFLFRSTRENEINFFPSKYEKKREKKNLNKVNN